MLRDDRDVLLETRWQEGADDDDAVQPSPRPLLLSRARCRRGGVMPFSDAAAECPRGVPHAQLGVSERGTWATTALASGDRAPLAAAGEAARDEGTDGGVYGEGGGGRGREARAAGEAVGGRLLRWERQTKQEQREGEAGCGGNTRLETTARTRSPSLPRRRQY